MTTTTNRYRLNSPGHYFDEFDGSLGLFRACWQTYRGFLNGAIDDPTCDSDVIDWLDQIAAELVNDPGSPFWIYG